MASSDKAASPINRNLTSNLTPFNGWNFISNQLAFTKQYSERPFEMSEDPCPYPLFS